MNIFQSRIGVVYANRLMMAGASIRIRNDDGMTALEVDVTDFHVVGRCILTEEEERQNRCLAIGLGSFHRTGKAVGRIAFSPLCPCAARAHPSLHARIPSVLAHSALPS
jgi:hypothetical protein